MMATALLSENEGRMNGSIIYLVLIATALKKEKKKKEHGGGCWKGWVMLEPSVMMLIYWDSPYIQNYK